mgnify:CR=1 FL=1
MRRAVTLFALLACVLSRRLDSQQAMAQKVTLPSGVTVARAVDALRNAGIAGPYGIAIAPEIFTRIVETTEHGGYPLFNHLQQILGGPVVWAPGVDCGAVLSLRGGDFRG